MWEWTATHFSKSSGQRVLRGGSYLDSAEGEFNHRVTVATRMGNTEDSAPAEVQRAARPALRPRTPCPPPPENRGANGSGRSCAFRSTA